MRTVLKLLITLLVLHGTYRVGVAYWQHYTFEDAVQQTIQFAQKATTDEVSASIVALAEEHGIPLEQEDLEVTRDRRSLTVDAAYTRNVELVPRFARPFRFTIHATALMLN